MRATRILLVEDNEMNRDMLSRRLSRKGFEVACATTGPQGVEMARTERPDLILMDIALGAMDGWEASQLIQADPASAHIPIIALTGHALASDRDRAIQNRLADFDTKPVDFARLLGKIQGVLDTAAPAAVQPGRGAVEAPVPQPARAQPTMA